MSEGNVRCGMSSSLPVSQRCHMRPRGWCVYLCCWVARYLLWSSVSTGILRRRMSTDLSLQSTPSVSQGQRTVCVSVRLQRTELYGHLSTRHMGTWLQPGNDKADGLLKLFLLQKSNVVCGQKLSDTLLVVIISTLSIASLEWRLIMYSDVSIRLCVSVIISCKQVISKTNSRIFAKFIADTSYVLGCVIGADHIQGGLLLAFVSFTTGSVLSHEI